MMTLSRQAAGAMNKVGWVGMLISFCGVDSECWWKALIAAGVFLIILMIANAEWIFRDVEEEEDDDETGTDESCR